jgi:hypothetical protein
MCGVECVKQDLITILSESGLLLLVRSVHLGISLFLCIFAFLNPFHVTLLFATRLGNSLTIDWVSTTLMHPVIFVHFRTLNEPCCKTGVIKNYLQALIGRHVGCR